MSPGKPSGDNGIHGFVLPHQTNPVTDASLSTASAGLGLSVFIDDEGGYTTVAFAVALLLSLTLVFSLAAAQWCMSRSADVQEVADAAAMAGANCVSAYATIVQVLDACVLSMGLLGVFVYGVGLVVAAIPYLQASSPKIIEVAQQILDARRRFARSAAEGLSRLEKAVPYLVMANSASCVSANCASGMNYVGVAIPFPRESKSDFSYIEEDIEEEDLEKRAEELRKASAKKEEADRRAHAARERGWHADNVDDPSSMRGRASKLSSLTVAQNPSYASAEVWRFNYARLRAINYYRARLASEHPVSGSVEERQRSRSREVFYDFAEDELVAARCIETEDRVDMELPELPHNRQTVSQTRLYTQPIWPTTVEDGTRTLHYGLFCPAARGSSAGNASLSSIDEGGCARCEVCRMDATAMGNVANASTNINNGFEHYWRIVVEASRDYEDAVDEGRKAEQQMREAAEEGADAFQDAIDLLSVKRPVLTPPGAYGCVAVVMRSTSTTVPTELTASFLSGAELPEGAAISAATLAPDDATDGNDVLSHVFDGMQTSGASLPVVDLLDGLMDLWGRLLVGYGSAYGNVSDTFGQLLDGVGGVFGEPVASWLRSKIKQQVKAAGFEPQDMRQRKPVLVNSQVVLDKAGYGKLAQLREIIQELPTNASELEGWCRKKATDLLGEIGNVTVAEIPVPGLEGVSIPLTIDLSTLG